MWSLTPFFCFLQSPRVLCGSGISSRSGSEAIRLLLLLPAHPGERHLPDWIIGFRVRGEEIYKSLLLPQSVLLLL